MTKKERNDYTNESINVFDSCLEKAKKLITDKKEFNEFLEKIKDVIIKHQTPDI